jgi:hypothetical protein
MDRVAGFVTGGRDSSRSIRRGLAVAAGTIVLAACGHPSSPSPANAIVTFRVVDETFKVLLTDPAVIDLARRTQAGTVKRFPSGRIVSGSDVNTGWTWHLADVELVEASIEVCDGRPSDVERSGATFGGGRYCPWSAVVVSIQDR